LARRAIGICGCAMTETLRVFDKFWNKAKVRCYLRRFHCIETILVIADGSSSV
jgi:hypothetical protein